MKFRVGCVAVGFLSLVLCLAAQTANTTASLQVPPPLMPFSGVANDEGGTSLSGVVSLTFSFYNSQQGDEPLWTETQNNVPLDPTGHYSVQLGITQPGGVPTTLFTTGEARWLGIQIAGQAQQPRVLLLSVPYALKAGDATTIGGLPPSAFLLAAPTTAVAFAAPGADASSASASAPLPSGAVTGTGTVGFLPLWDSTSDIISSVVFQSGSGNTARIGVGTITPASTLDVKGGGTIRGLLSLPASGMATATKGADSQPLDLAASAFSSSTSKAVAQTFQWQAEPTANDTANPSGTLNLLFGSGVNKPAETGLNIASNGIINFATGQTFPGIGTVTSIGSGAGLTGGPITSSGTLSIATGGVSNAMLANPSLTVAAGTDLTGGGAVTLGGSTTLNVDTTKVPQLAAANTFTSAQTINGNILLPNTTSAGTQGVIEFGGVSFIHNYGPSGSFNSFFGRIAGSLTNTGFFLTAVGDYALVSDTSGSYNTALGYNAGSANTTGSSNTFLGYIANAGSNNLSNATAIGANAEATESNTLILGSIAGLNGAAVGTSVGIGTTTPAHTLEVKGTGNFSSGVTGVSSTASTLSGTNLYTGGTGISGSGGTGVAGVSTVCCDSSGFDTTGPGGSFTGYTAASESALSGSDGVDSTGGNGDPFSGDTGGNGIDAYGGLGGNPGGNDGTGGYFAGANSGAGFGDGVDAFAGSDWAGNFVGDLNVTGQIFAGTKDFKIDHPLDPANKYLVHASVESSEMMNIYTGNVTTDGEGHAMVQMPEWFEVLNTDFRYQLTVIGQFAQAIVGRKMENNRFEIRTSVPNVEVSWQVTGVRQDAYAKAHPLVIEQEKGPRLSGFYIHPELYGAQPEKQIEWARHPQTMKRMQETRARQLAATQQAVPRK